MVIMTILEAGMDLDIISDKYKKEKDELKKIRREARRDLRFFIKLLGFRGLYKIVGMNIGIKHIKEILGGRL